MGNVGIYRVGKEFGKTLFLFAKQRVSRVSHEIEVLANLTVWHDSSASSHVLYTWSFEGYSSRKLVTNFTDLLLKLDSSLISHTHPLQLNPHKYREMIEENTIKFNTELKPTKASWKSQLYMFEFSFSQIDVCQHVVIAYMIFAIIL